MCEGEKDVEAVRDVETDDGHEIATTCAFGASSWNDEIAKPLYGAAEVIVCADRDEAGREYARKVVNSLHGHVGMLRVVEAAEGNDVFDHLEAGWGLDDLVEVELGEVEGDGLFHFMTMAELLAQPDHFTWTVQGMWCDPTFGMIAGELKTLKSHLALFFHIALASGVPVFGEFSVPMARDVVTWCAEGGWRLYRRRAERIAAAMGVRLDDLPIHPCFDVAPINSEPLPEEPPVGIEPVAGGVRADGSVLHVPRHRDQGR